ncbi:MAG TPA: Rne/Rng family ribonuclease [Thermodesulfobacteriota bacterium]|nr:Rne/Rng family ribonuclease [Thermodesulfobacteriota bacterium]
MESRILINVTFGETRVAVTENGALAELYIERRSQPRIVGNIYKGRVGKIIPGMQAAFIDLGLEKSGFISVEDVQEDLFPDFFIEEEENKTDRKRHKHPIQDMLREGQEILVQALKESTGGKGAKLSSYIAIPGKYLVLLGTVDLIGISRKIEDSKERNRLSNIISNYKPKGIGFIARTASLGRDEDEIRQDMDYLIRIWEEIKQKSEGEKAPALVYEEPSLHVRAVRDLITGEVKSIIVDSNEVYQEISSYLLSRFPDFNVNLELYTDTIPLFTRFGIDAEIKKIFQKKVWLKSGGYLIIEEAEALTVIDINTGRYLSGVDQEETIFNINIEAASEAARQIRLRNLVGIIVIDFIDMKNSAKRKEAFETFIQVLNRDKARSAVLEMSSFGVVQMTRQRTRESLLKSLAETCSSCDGTGYVTSRETVSYEILREIKSHILKPLIRRVTARANPDVIRTLRDLEGENLEKLLAGYSTEILFEPVERKFNEFEIKLE